MFLGWDKIWGNPWSHQYRSEIFYNTKEEKISAQKVLDETNKKLNGKVVTVIKKEKNYCKAEEYHQKYYQKNHWNEFSFNQVA